MKKLQKLERRLISALQEQYGNPNEEAPMPLREQPSEIVFTALLPTPEPASKHLNYQPSAPPREANLGIGAESGVPQPVATPPPEAPGNRQPPGVQPPGMSQAPGRQQGGQSGMQAAMAQMMGGKPEPQERPRGRTGTSPEPQPRRREEDDLQSLLVRG